MIGETVDAVLLIDEIEAVYEDMSGSIIQREGAEEAVAVLKRQLQDATSTPPVNRGLPLSQVSQRQQTRKVSTLKTAIEKALWFVESFGVSVQSVTLQHHMSESPLVLNYASSSSISSSSTVSIPSDEALYQTLYLLDRFGVSDEFYHELSIVYPSLARSYKVKRARKRISDTIDIERLPLPYHGARRPFKPCLTALLLHELKDSDHDGKVVVKVSGDGAQFSRTSKFLLLTFSLPFLSSNALAGHGNHTFAVVKADEDFDVLRIALREPIDEVNELMSSGEIDIGDKMIEVDIYLGGDYKFLLMTLGLNAAHATYSCLWCTVDCDHRWDMSVTMGECKMNERTLQDLNDCCSKSDRKERLGCIHPPLLDIQLDHVVVDELHLWLRITDRLINNIILRMAQLDHSKRTHHGEKQPDNMEKLITSIQSIGVHFNVWKKKEGEGRSSDKFGFTAINGRQRLLVFKQLPPMIPDLVGGEKPEVFRQVFEDFLALYMIVSARTLSQTQRDSVHETAKSWIRLFLSLGTCYEGFQRSYVTPYMHILTYHVPEMINRLGSIKPFSGQGVEKNNDDAKRNYFSSNRHDAAGDILLTEARLEELRRGTFGVCVRKKRVYQKTDDAYWNEGGIQESRRAKRAATT